MSTRRAVCALICVLAVGVPALATAQASRSGDTFVIGGTTPLIEQPDIAYDSTNNQYLQVAGKVFIEGHLLSAAGSLIKRFQISDGTYYAQNPRVTFSPDVTGGGYLVTWHASVGDIARVHGRIFNATGVAVTGEFTIATSASSVALSTQWTMGAPSAYATGSKEFLVVWGGNKYTSFDIIGQRVGTTGALLGGNFLISGGGANLYDRDPSVAYNPKTNNFYVGWGIYDEGGRYGYAGGRMVGAGTGALGTTTFFGAAAGVSITSVAYNDTANQFLFGWHHQTKGGQFHYGVVLDANGVQVGDIRVLSGYYAAYDALDIEFNARAGEYFLITHGVNHEDAGVTITGAGNARDNGFLVTSTSGINGNFHPRLATSTTEKKWLVVTASQFKYASGQFITSVGTGASASKPGAASLIAPSGAIAQGSTAFKWNAVPSATHYQLFVSDSAGERVNRWYTADQVGCGAGNGTCSIVPAETLAGGQATWWVLTSNLQGYSPWSTGMSFTVVVPAPATAALVSPLGDTEPAPTFRWSAAVGATWYYLWVTDNSGKPRIQKWYSAAQTGCENGGQCSVSPGVVMSPGVNYWWVQTWSSAGGYGAWSAAGTFAVPLAAPSSLGVQTDPQVIYRWGTVEGATHYYLYVSDYTGTARIQKWYSAVELGCVSGTTCAVAAPSSLPFGEAQFWIQAWSSELAAANRPAYSGWSSGLIFKHP